MFRKENGVTLVALVITIIVLLILAGVTVSMVLGDDGILKQAEDAGESQELGLVRDISTSAMAAAFVRVKTNATDKAAGVGAVLVDELIKMQTSYTALTAVGAVSGSTITVTYNGTHYLITFGTGSITSVAETATAPATPLPTAMPTATP